VNLANFEGPPRFVTLSQFFRRKNYLRHVDRIRPNTQKPESSAARRDGDRFDCATWLHKAIELPKEGFKREVEKHLTSKETEPWEIIYFELYKSQLPVIERALETAALMLGASKSRGYCLEMICADFLAGAHLEGGNSDSLLFALSRLYSLLPDPQKTEFVQQMGKVQ